MPRFPNFRRKSQVTEDRDAPVESSFRVLERTEVGAGKSFDGGARFSKATGGMPKTTLSEITTEDNIFSNMKSNRNASTAPSSTDFTATPEDGRSLPRKPVHETSGHHHTSSKSSGGGFLKQAGRTFSFGGSKKNSLPTIPADQIVPPMPDGFEPQTPGNRSRAQTASTTATATPPQVEDRDFTLDLGGDLSNMLSAFNKRASVATVKEDSGRTPLASRNLTGNRGNQPSPLHLDRISAVEAPPKSWNSQTSNDNLLGSGRGVASPPATYENLPPPVPRHGVNPSPMPRISSPVEDEDAALLKDSLAATNYLSRSIGGPSNAVRGNEDTLSNLRETYTRPSRPDNRFEDDNMFETSFGRSSRSAQQASHKGNGPPHNKVMTPAEFEKYQRDKVRQQAESARDKDLSNSDDEDNYEDEEDDIEKTKEMAKQRRKQEAHMTVYRQQMMKVTGEQPGMAPSRPSLSMSMSTPNLPLNPSGSNSPPSDGSEDEDVPLGILAAHGFPNKQRPPTRLSTVGSNPNLRASIQPSYSVGPGSAAGDNAPRPGGPLPAFARKLPQDPFLGAGLINQPPRESFALGGGSPAPQNRAAPVGGLVGVIANEERQRALRRGSPAIDGKNALPPSMQMPMNPGMAGGFDPVAGIPPQMMYPMAQPQMPVTPGDQAQIQMTQQMAQFMQMQMQFMQMMTGQNTSQTPMAVQMPMQMPMQMQMPGQGPPRPVSHMQNHSMGSMLDVNRASFLGDPLQMGMGMGNGSLGMNNNMGMESVRGDSAMRTMSMVQPSSSSWIQPPKAGYTPSIRIQGTSYAPSIAPSERSNIGLPGRYRPVSSMAPLDVHARTQTMSGALPSLPKLSDKPKVANDDDDDDEKGWEELKAKREKKKSIWKTKKSFGNELGSLIS